MNIKCALGFHDWSRDCKKCKRCGKVRSRDHDWAGNCEACENCSQIRPNAHAWNGCKCATCGSKRSEGHEWNGNSCTICSTTKQAALFEDCRVAALQAIRRDLLDTSDLFTFHSGASSSQYAHATKRAKYIGDAIEGVAKKWNLPIEEVLPMFESYL